MSTTLLNDAYDRVQIRMAGKVEPLARMYGVTLVSDGATSIDRTPVLNLLRAAPGVMEFVKAKDCTGATKNSQYIADFITDYVQTLPDPRQVVSVVMDNATRSSWRIIESTCPWIACVPCIPHCCDLELEDFAKKVPFFKDVIQKAATVRKFIVNHQRVLAEFGEVAVSAKCYYVLHHACAYKLDVSLSTVRSYTTRRFCHLRKQC